MPSTVTSEYQRKEMIAPDSISSFFGCGATESSCEIRPADSDYHIQIVSPFRPVNPINLEYRYNWQIVKVQGIDDTVDEVLSTETSKFSDGTRIKGSRREARTIQITVKVCPCEGCDYLTHKRELVQLAKCAGCNLKGCEFCCTTDEICVTDYAMKDLRSCHLRIKCCDVIRQIPVRLTGKITTQRKGGCLYYTLTYLAADPNFHHPRMQTQEFSIDPEDEDALFCPVQLRGDVVLSRIMSFKKTITIPYIGSITGYPRFTIKGAVSNLKITNDETGAFVFLNNLEDTSAPYTIDGCAPHVLNFWRGQQEYTDNKGGNIFANLSGGCSNLFTFPVTCDGEFTLTIEGDAVDVDTFFMRIDWWTEYDEFYADDPAFAVSDPPYTIQECAEGCQQEFVFDVTADELYCPEELCADDGFIDLSSVNEFNECVTLPFTDSRGTAFPKIVVRGHVDSLVISNPLTGQVWDFNSDDIVSQVSHFRNCQVRILDYSVFEQYGVTEDCPVPVGDVSTALALYGDTELCITGKNIDPEDFSIEFVYRCSGDDRDIPITERIC